MLKSYKLLFILSIFVVNSSFASENIPPLPQKNHTQEATNTDSTAIKIIKKILFWDYFVTSYYEKNKKKDEIKIETPQKEVKLPNVAQDNSLEQQKIADKPAQDSGVKYNAPLQPVSPQPQNQEAPQQIAQTPASPAAPETPLQPQAPAAPKLPDEFENKSQPVAQMVQENDKNQKEQTSSAPLEPTKPASSAQAEPATQTEPASSVSPSTSATSVQAQPATQTEPAISAQATPAAESKPVETEPKKPTDAEILAQADKDILISEQPKPRNAPSLADLEKQASKTPEEKAKEEIEALELAAFMKDELLMLEFPRDEIVLGNLTSTARIASLNISDYIKYFWKSYDRKTSFEKSRIIREFIHEVAQPPVLLDLEDAKREALIAINSNDIGSLRAILNHTKPNLLDINDSDFNLIQASVGIDNYNTTYYLIMRGANVNVTNMEDNQTLIQLAQQNNSPSMVWLLKRAGAKDYGW